MAEGDAITATSGDLSKELSAGEGGALFKWDRNGVVLYKNSRLIFDNVTYVNDERLFATFNIKENGIELDYMQSIKVNGIEFKNENTTNATQISVTADGKFTIAKNKIIVILEAGQSAIFTNGSGFTLNGGATGATYTVNVDGTYSEVTK